MNKEGCNTKHHLAEDLFPLCTLANQVPADPPCPDGHHSSHLSLVPTVPEEPEGRTRLQRNSAPVGWRVIEDGCQPQTAIQMHNHRHASKRAYNTHLRAHYIPVQKKSIKRTDNETGECHH